MSSSLFAAPHPLVPLATFNVVDGHTAALEGCDAVGMRQHEVALLRNDGTPSTPQEEVPKYSLFPSEEPQSSGNDGPPDFLGRLHHLKTLFRMSATKEPVSVMIHRVGPLLILEDGPSGWSHGDSNPTPEPLPPLSDSSQQRSLEIDSQLMLAALEPSLAEAIAQGPPGLELPKAASGQRLCVRNTFLDVVDSDVEEEMAGLGRTFSAPPCFGAASPATPRSSGGETPPGAAVQQWDLPMSPVIHQLEEHAASRVPDQWSLIPYEASETLAVPPHLDLLQMASAKRKAVRSTSRRVLEAVRSLYTGIPPQPSRFGRSVEWRCGPFKILLGCDLVVLRRGDNGHLCDEFSDDFASFKMLPPGSTSAEPSREERIDVYLENLMCDITKAVLGSNQQGQTTWRVFNTADLPAASPAEGHFDGQQLQEQGQRLLHFLRQQCRREGGTYWLFREQNAPAVELFDLSASANLSAEDNERWNNSRAFRTTPSLALPIASLCLRLAKSMPHNADQRQLLEKGLHLLEPVKEDHVAMYSMTALQLACSYLRAPLPALHDLKAAGSSASKAAASAPPAEPPAAARLTLALRYLESILKLLTSLDDTDRDEVALIAELCLQAHVAYTECILRLVREVCIPTYSTWLSEVRKQSAEVEGGAALKRMKQLSAALLLWRLFWLCRAQRAFAFLPVEKREAECWTLDRDLCETSGDALYGLSRYSVEDVESFGQLASAAGICKLVEEGLRSWGLHGPGRERQRRGAASPKLRANGERQLASPLGSPRASAAAAGHEEGPHNLEAMLLSSLNPLTRGVGDESLREDPLVRDDLRKALWSDGRALAQSLLFYKRATARLRKAAAPGEAPGESEAAQHGQRRRASAEDQATVKVARKLAHLYNEEARAALRVGGSDSEEVEGLLNEARHWMLLCGDHANAARVLVNLSELYAQRAEQGEDEAEEVFSEAQYSLWLKAVECCEEAAAQSENGLGKREGAFAHLRVGVSLSIRVPTQDRLAGSRRSETVSELANRHLSRALRLFDELHDEREIAVCHFHMADLVLQEQSLPSAAPVSKSRLIAALRHARRSSEHWERAGALEYPKDYIASHLRIARLLECQARTGTSEALGHLSEVETSLVGLANSQPLRPDAEEHFIRERLPGAAGRATAVVAFRREMARICQAGLRKGEQVEHLKAVYRRVLRNEPLMVKPGPGDRKSLG